MTGPSPEFTNSKYFVAKPHWHMLPATSDEEKQALEKYVNSKWLLKELKKEHPDMKNPMINWEGKIVDRG